ncbi:hypothetical protein JCM11251_003780 [Rhodosporidiobolus azoricus]
MARQQEPDKIPVNSPRDLAVEVDTLLAVLALNETEDTWEKINKAVKRFQAVVRGGACKFTDEFVHAMRDPRMVKGITRSLASERGALSGTTLELVASCTRLGAHFHALLHQYLPTVLRLLAKPSKLYITRAASTLTSIIKNTHLVEVIKYIVIEWRNEAGKSSTFREQATIAVTVMLGTDTGVLAVDKDQLEKRVADLEWLIKTGATGKEATVRADMKKCWEVYKREWPERVASFTAPMTPTIRKYLKVSDGVASSAPSAPPTRTAAPAAKKTHPLATSHGPSSSSAASHHAPSRSASASTARSDPAALAMSTSSSRSHHGELAHSVGMGMPSAHHRSARVEPMARSTSASTTSSSRSASRNEDRHERDQLAASTTSSTDASAPPAARSGFKPTAPSARVLGTSTLASTSTSSSAGRLAAGPRALRAAAPSTSSTATTGAPAEPRKARRVAAPPPIPAPAPAPTPILTGPPSASASSATGLSRSQGASFAPPPAAAALSRSSASTTINSSSSALPPSSHAPFRPKLTSSTAAAAAVAASAGAAKVVKPTSRAPLGSSATSTNSSRPAAPATLPPREPREKKERAPLHAPTASSRARAEAKAKDKERDPSPDLVRKPAPSAANDARAAAVAAARERRERRAAEAAAAAVEAERKKAEVSGRKEREKREMREREEEERLKRAREVPLPVVAAVEDEENEEEEEVETEVEVEAEREVEKGDVQEVLAEVREEEDEDLEAGPTDEPTQVLPPSSPLTTLNMDEQAEENDEEDEQPEPEIAQLPTEQDPQIKVMGQEEEEEELTPVCATASEAEVAVRAEVGMDSDLQIVESVSAPASQQLEALPPPPPHAVEEETRSELVETETPVVEDEEEAEQAVEPELDLCNMRDAPPSPFISSAAPSPITSPAIAAPILAFASTPSPISSSTFVATSTPAPPAPSFVPTDGAAEPPIPSPTPFTPPHLPSFSSSAARPPIVHFPTAAFPRPLPPLSPEPFQTASIILDTPPRLDDLPGKVRLPRVKAPVVTVSLPRSRMAEVEVEEPVKEVAEEFMSADDDSEEDDAIAPGSPSPRSPLASRKAPTPIATERPPMFLPDDSDSPRVGYDEGDTTFEQSDLEEEEDSLVREDTIQEDSHDFDVPLNDTSAYNVGRTSSPAPALVDEEYDDSDSEPAQSPVARSSQSTPVASLPDPTPALSHTAKDTAPAPVNPSSTPAGISYPSALAGENDTFDLATVFAQQKAQERFSASPRLMDDESAIFELRLERPELRFGDEVSLVEDYATTSEKDDTGEMVVPVVSRRRMEASVEARAEDEEEEDDEPLKEEEEEETPVLLTRSLRSRVVTVDIDTAKTQAKLPARLTRLTRKAQVVLERERDVLGELQA